MNSKRSDELDGMSKYIADKLQPMLKHTLQNATKCCPNCEHFQGDPVVKCGLNGLRPPATVIAFGCECFKDNDCPF